MSHFQGMEYGIWPYKKKADIIFHAKVDIFHAEIHMVEDPHGSAAWEENRLAYERQHYCKNERSAESVKSG